MENSGNIIIFQTEDGLTKLDVQAIEKVTNEYRKWQANTLLPVEQEYMSTIKVLSAETRDK